MKKFIKKIIGIVVYSIETVAIMIAIIVVLSLFFHVLILNGNISVFPKDHITFSNTLITQKDVNALIDKYNNASFMERNAMEQDPLFRKLQEKKIIIDSSESEQNDPLNQLLNKYSGTNSNGNNSNQDNRSNTEDILKQIVINWNATHSLNTINQITDLYGSNVVFYGTTMSNNEVYNKKLLALQKSNGYKQEIDNIKVKSENDEEYRCDFIKHATVNQKTTDYPSYLVFRKENNEWKIIVESDEVTDENIITSKIEEIPEVEAMRSKDVLDNFMIYVYKPTNDEPYYTATATYHIPDPDEDKSQYGDGCRYFNYDFHVYINPYRIMYYDSGSKSEMTLEQWRKENK